MRFLLWPQKNQAFLGTFLGPPSRDSDVMAAKCKPSPWIRKCAVERVQRSDDFPWTEEDCPSKKRSNTAYPFLRQGSHTVPAWRFTWQCIAQWHILVLFAVRALLLNMHLAVCASQLKVTQMCPPHRCLLANAKNSAAA